MGIFKDQGYSILTLDTGIDISGATIKRILWVKPDKSTGYFDAELSGNKKLVYQASNETWDQEGKWYFQAYVEIGGLKAFGDIVNENIYRHI